MRPSTTSTRQTAEQDLIARSRAFAQDDHARAWWHVGSTLALLALAIGVAAAAPWWPLRIVGLVLEAMLLIRTFILFHDYSHGSLLRGSKPARGLFNALGVLMLTPPKVWAATHNFHHANTGRIEAKADGTYMLWTTEQWQKASRKERLGYVIERHPITMMLGVVTVFVFSLCLIPFVREPRKNWSAGLAVLVHLALSASLILAFGVGVYLTAMLIPMALAYAFGSYLFFVQHNFEQMKVREESDWSHAAGALETSSYLALGPVMHWFTGNIGYHHVHHLNPRIPFYRLPEAMAAIPELQNPPTATLRPREVWSTLTSLDLWDPQTGRMVPFRAAEADFRQASPAL